MNPEQQSIGDPVSRALKDQDIRLQRYRAGKPGPITATHLPTGCQVTAHEGETHDQVIARLQQAVDRRP